MLVSVVIFGDDVCCSVLFGTLVDVFVFSVIWSELLMTYVISCPLWYECTSAIEWSVRSHGQCDVLCALVYVRICCFVVRGWAFSRRDINVCNCDMFSVVNLYLGHFEVLWLGILMV